MFGANMKLTLLLSSYLVCRSLALTGGHDQIPIAADADWATKHMAGKQFSHYSPR
jgi:hypothetical protein